MIQIISFLGSLWGKVALGAGIVAALIGLRAWDVSHQRSIGVKREQVRVESVGRKIDERAQKKRERVERAKPAEIDAALRKYCRDC